MNVGVVKNEALDDDETLRYAIPVIWHMLQTSSGRRSPLCTAGAGDGDVLKTMLNVAVPLVVAGNVTVAETPPLIGPKLAVTGEGPTTTDADDVAGRITAGVGVGVGPPTIGGASRVEPPPQPARTQANPNASAVERRDKR